jgi:hypothetical protein
MILGIKEPARHGLFNTGKKTSGRCVRVLGDDVDVKIVAIGVDH